MTIGLLEVKIKIDNSHSLKEKRMILRSLKERLRNKFNIAISEVGEQDKWQISQLCLVSVNTDKRFLNSLLCKIMEFIQNFPQIEVIDYHTEFI